MALILYQKMFLLVENTPMHAHTKIHKHKYYCYCHYYYYYYISDIIIALLKLKLPEFFHARQGCGFSLSVDYNLTQKRRS